MNGAGEHSSPDFAAVRTPNLAFKSGNKSLAVQDGNELRMPLRPDIHAGENVVHRAPEEFRVLVTHQMSEGRVDLHELAVACASEDSFICSFEVVLIRV